MADRRRWTILAVGTFAQAATCCFLYGIPMLLPAPRASGVSLFAASLVVSAPMVGLLLTLILWGAVADRRGERVVIVAGGGAGAPPAAGGGGGGPPRCSWWRRWCRGRSSSPSCSRWPVRPGHRSTRRAGASSWAGS